MLTEALWDTACKNRVLLNDEIKHLGYPANRHVVGRLTALKEAGYKYLAKDDDGSWHGYIACPTWDGIEWVAKGGRILNISSEPSIISLLGLAFSSQSASNLLITLDDDFHMTEEKQLSFDFEQYSTFEL